MELSTSPSLWAYGSVWLFFSLLVYFKFSHSDMVLTPALLVYFFLLVIFEWFCHLYLPILLGMVLLSSACCYVLSIASPRKMLPVAEKAVLITGCDSGFGKATAERMDEMGFKVIATVLDPNSPGAKDLRKRCSDRLTILQMDLTKPEDIKRAQQVAKEQTHETGLWALVNNAGYCVHFGDAELSLMSTYRGCMEVNFFGTLEFTKALLPMLRSSKGRIVTVSSPAGDHSFPFLAAYGSSKAALARVMDTFRHELMPWGVKVSIIQPGSYKTVKSVKTKWRSIRDTYTRELKAQIEENRSGSGLKQRKCYLYFEQLNFLKPIVHMRRTESNLDDEDADGDEHDEENMDCRQNVPMFSDSPHNQAQESIPTPKPGSPDDNLLPSEHLDSSVSRDTSSPTVPR